jgi:hypothetical protein
MQFFYVCLISVFNIFHSKWQNEFQNSNKLVFFCYCEFSPFPDTKMKEVTNWSCFHMRRPAKEKRLIRSIPAKPEAPGTGWRVTVTCHLQSLRAHHGRGITVQSTWLSGWCSCHRECEGMVWVTALGTWGCYRCFRTGGQHDSPAFPRKGGAISEYRKCTCWPQVLWPLVPAPDLTRLWGQGGAKPEHRIRPVRTQATQAFQTWLVWDEDQVHRGTWSSPTDPRRS